MEFRDLKRQYQVLKKELDEAMTTVAAGGSYIFGEPVSELEKELADYIGTRHCVTCANGTDAMSLALIYWGIGPGDAVFVPDFTFFATAEVVCREGATPVLVDVDSSTFNMDPARLEQAIRLIIDQGSLRPRLIIPVDLFGRPADYTRIIPLARQYGLKILEDGAQGFGGSLLGRRSCTFGDAAATSFYPAKPLGCYGDGGAVFTDDDAMAAALRSIRAHGRGDDKYDNIRIGLNSRLDTLQAAILRVKFRAFRQYELDQVNRAAVTYGHLLEPAGVEMPVIPDGMVSSWAQFTIRTPDPVTRDRLQQDLKQQGIPSVIYYPRPLHAQTALRTTACYDESALPWSTRLSNTVLSLPMHPYLTDEDVATIALAVGRSVRRQV